MAQKKNWVGVVGIAENRAKSAQLQLELGQ